MIQCCPGALERNSCNIGKVVWVSITPATQSSQPSKNRSTSSTSPVGDRLSRRLVGVIRCSVPSSRVISLRSRSL